MLTNDEESRLITNFSSFSNASRHNQADVFRLAASSQQPFSNSSAGEHRLSNFAQAFTAVSLCCGVAVFFVLLRDYFDAPVVSELLLSADRGKLMTQQEKQVLSEASPMKDKNKALEHAKTLSDGRGQRKNSETGWNMDGASAVEDKNDDGEM
jgi:hypothetical protein